jgi:glycosyltransferase involved in cell wall biosynthesis
MVVSKTLREYYRSQYQRETIYVPNGASDVPRRPPQQLLEWGLLPDQYVLFLGRFSPEKNCHLLIEAFENMGGDMKLVLAGGSSHSDSYVQKLRSHESERIRFLPWVSGSNLEELLSHAAILVLPSELEGLSLALLDAMAAGVCVLTSDIPENREVVDGAGYTFRRGDRSDLERMFEPAHAQSRASTSGCCARTGTHQERISLERDCDLDREGLPPCTWLAFHDAGASLGKEVLVEAQPTCLSANSMD